MGRRACGAAAGGTGYGRQYDSPLQPPPHLPYLTAKGQGKVKGEEEKGACEGKEVG